MQKAIVGSDSIPVFAFSDRDSYTLVVNRNYEIISSTGKLPHLAHKVFNAGIEPGNNLFQTIRTDQVVVNEIATKFHEALKGHSSSNDYTIQMDGEEIPLKIHLSPIFGEGGIDGAMLQLEQSFAEKKLTEGYHSALEHAFNSLDTSVMVLNNQHEIIELNEAAKEHFLKAIGIKINPGAKVSDVYASIYGGEQDLWVFRFNEGLSGRQKKYIDQYLINNSVSFYETTITPIVKNDRMDLISVVTKDITALKRVEQELQKTSIEYEKMHRELDRFVYSASHDLRSPIMTIKGLLRLIKHDTESDPAVYYSMIEKSLGKLEYFISEITNYGYNLNAQVTPEEINLDALVADCIQSLGFTQDTSKVEFLTNFQQGTPFFSDKKRLHIILEHIISNAVNYRDKHKPSFLKITGIINSTSARLIFSDNGIGIDEKHQKNLFEMFRRSSENSKGPGLGLFIVKETITRLNGTISLNSRLGNGTIITITLPNQAVPKAQ